MKTYKIKLTAYEVSLLKYLLHERKIKLLKKFDEVKDFNWSSGIKKAGIETENLLRKFIELSNNSSDFYNYDIHPRSVFDLKSKSYNDLLKSYFDKKNDFNGLNSALEERSDYFEED